MKNSPKGTRKFIFRAGIVVLGLLFIGWVSYETWLRTVHSVIPHKVYRSAQLSSETLEYFVKKKRIKTVINMRGSQTNAKWYQNETNAMKKLGVQHYDIAMNSYKLPSKERIRKLTYLLMTSPKPILVHCLGGADRTGLASALALILNNSSSLRQSEQQFSLSHFVISKRSVGKLVFPYYTNWLKQQGIKNNRRNFLAWLCTKNPLHQNDTYPQSKNLVLYNQLFMKEACRSTTNNTL